MIYFSIIFWVSNSQILVRWTNISAWRLEIEADGSMAVQLQLVNSQIVNPPDD